MRAGALRHQIVIQEPSESHGLSGEVISVWSAFATVFAAYEPQSGKESQTEDQEQAFNTARFRIRYLSGVVPKMRILFDGRYFDIEAINDVGGRRKQLHIMAREHV